MVTTSAPKSRQPDYIATNQSGTTLIVLEAKGTQSRNYARRQIKSGCGQVSTIKLTQLPKSTNVLRVVVGTELQREDQGRSSRILVGDPAEKNSFDYVFHRPPAFLSERANFARLCYLVGDIHLGTLVDPLIHTQGTGPVALVCREIGDREYAGSILEVRHRDSPCGLFLGLDEDVRARIAKLAGLPQFPESPSVGMEFERSAGGRAQHDVGDDGLAMEVWSEGPLSTE